MAEHAELAFVKNLITTLAAHQPTFSDDFQQEPELQLKRVPVLNIAVPPPPERATAEDVAVSNISVTFKSSKPAFSSTIDVSPADSIASIKARIASSHSSAPSADALRLLLKGKALADSKLAKDYGLKDADVVNVMVKPGFEPSASPSSTPTSADAPPVTVVSASSPIAAPQPKTPGSLALPADSAPRAAKRGHGRIPSVVLSPSPSPSADGDEVVRDIPLVDEHGVTISAELEAAEHAHHAVTGRSSYHAMVATPEYWQKLFAFMNSQFPVRSDAIQAFEDYLNATKGALTASEIARIRDHVGVTGMAGT